MSRTWLPRARGAIVSYRQAVGAALSSTEPTPLAIV